MNGATCEDENIAGGEFLSFPGATKPVGRFFGHVIWRKRVFNRKVMDSFKKVTGRRKYKIKHNIVLFINVVNPRMPKFENLVIITTC